MRYALGIDGGASSGKWAVLDEEGRLVARGRTAPLWATCSTKR